MKLVCKAGIAAVVFAVFLVSCKSSGPTRKYAGMVADMDPIKMTSLEAEFNKTLGGLQKKKIDVYFRPRSNVVSLEFRYEMVVYKQLWSPDGQAAFKAGLERYKEDFNNRVLKQKGAGQAYGKFRGKTEWASTNTSLSIVSYSLPQFDIGYVFKGGNPYFRVLMRGAKQEEKMHDDTYPESLEISMYFTIAQAEAVAKLFEKDTQLALLGPLGPDGYYQAEIDEYNAKEEAGVLGGVKNWAGKLAEDVTGSNPFSGDKPIGGAEGDSYNRDAPAEPAAAPAAPTTPAEPAPAPAPAEPAVPTAPAASAE